MYYNLMCIRIGMYKFIDCQPIERFMRFNIYRLLIGSEIKFGQLLLNCVSSGFPNVAAYATWHVSNLRLLLCCALIALVSSVLMLGDRLP